MPLVSRELAITYGTTTIGAGTNYIIDGKFKLDKNYVTGTVTCEVIAWDTTEAAFATTCATLEAAFRTPRQTVVIQFNSTTQVTWSASANSGFDAVPSIRKLGQSSDTGRSRRYEISVTVTLPADLAGQNGRRWSSVNLMTTESGRRRLHVSGEYTALGSNSARTQYQSSIAAYIASLTSGFGGTWEGPFDQQEVANDTNKTLSFSLMYEELIYNQSVGLLDDPNVRRQRLNVSRSVPAPGDSTLVVGGSVVTPRRLQTIAIDYEAAIDKSVTQDLVGVYTSTIKPFLLSVAAKSSNAAALALISDAPRYDWPQNRIATTMVLRAADTAGLLTCYVRTDDSQDYGHDLVAAWDSDGMAKYNFQGPQSMLRIITAITTAIDSGDYSDTWGTTNPFLVSAPTGSGIPLPGKSPDGGTLVPVILSTNVATTPTVLGRSGDPQLRVVQKNTVTRIAFVVAPSDGSSGVGKPPIRTATGVGGGASGGASNPPTATGG